MKTRSAVKGTTKLRRALRRLPLESRRIMGNVLEAEGKALRDMIAADAPKDKGDLARAVRHKVANDKLSVHVGYSPSRAGFKRHWKKGGFTAIWQEFGTRHHPADPFIRPSFRQRVPATKALMRAALNRMLRGARNWS